MDKTAVATFATESHYKLQDEFYKLYKGYFDRIFSYDDLLIKRESFYEENPIFKYKKYFGFFLWKPFIIKTILDGGDSDLVLYSDSNLRFTDILRFKYIIGTWFDSDNHIFISKYNHYFNRNWTKRDCFKLMGADSTRYYDANQVWSVIMAFDKSRESTEFISEWLEYNKDERVVSDLPSQLGPELEGFTAHRWDQSILSIMVEKYNIKCFPYNDLLGVVDKIYPQEVLDKKAQIDSDPLQTY